MNRDDRPTTPPTDAELESLAEFELLIHAVGERDARFTNLGRLVYADGEALALAEDKYFG